MLSVSEYIAMAKEFIDEPIVASKVDAYIDENDEPEKVSIYQMQRQVKLHENEMTDIDQCYAFYIDPLIALHEKEHAMAYMGMSQFQFVNLMTEADEKGLEMIIEGLITHKTNITVLDGYRKKMGLKNKLTATIDTYFNIPEPLTEFGINEYKKFDLDRQTISFDSPETTVMYFDYLVTVLPWNVYNVEMSKDLHAESVLYEINGILIHLTRAANATSGKILLSREKEAKQAISNL